MSYLTSINSHLRLEVTTYVSERNPTIFSF